MPASHYEPDILAWSDHQADLLRRQPAPWPVGRPCSVDQLLNDNVAALGAALAAAAQGLAASDEAPR
jgi:hypothetical protein